MWEKLTSIDFAQKGKIKRPDTVGLSMEPLDGLGQEELCGVQELAFCASSIVMEEKKEYSQTATKKENPKKKPCMQRTDLISKPGYRFGWLGRKTIVSSVSEKQRLVVSTVCTAS